MVGGGQIENVNCEFLGIFLGKGQAFFSRVENPMAGYMFRSLDAPFDYFSTTKLDNIGRINYLFFKSFISGTIQYYVTQKSIFFVPYTICITFKKSWTIPALRNIRMVPSLTKDL